MLGFEMIFFLLLQDSVVGGSSSRWLQSNYRPTRLPAFFSFLFQVYYTATNTHLLKFF